jgi:hypothetical protein
MGILPDMQQDMGHSHAQGVAQRESSAMPRRITMRDAVQLAHQSAEEAENRRRQAALAEAHGSALPTSAGFYWWRETEASAWRMVQIVDCGNGYLNSYDVQLRNWGGRSMKSWAEWFPVGQWVAVLPPDAPDQRPAE